MDRDVEVIQALGDPTRLRLLNLLMQAKEICVCELVEALQLPQYKVSRHLQVLTSVGWLDDRRQGKWVYYRISTRLRSFQHDLLRSIGRLREGREDFRQDEARAGRRLSLRRDGLCCVGLVPTIGTAAGPSAPAPQPRDG
jgi:ArsR family transcriptional regulator